MRHSNTEQSREIAFPLSPKDAVEKARESYTTDTVNYAWQVVTSAAAQADKRMLSARGVENGMHTDIVAGLITPYALGKVIPAERQKFYRYHEGQVHANWASKDTYDKHRHDTLFFAGLARNETLDLAELDDDIRSSFKEGIMVQTIDTYVGDISKSVAELIPSDDFPYRTLKTRSEASEFWGYIINGDDQHPGLMAAAASLNSTRDQWIAGLRSIYGEDARLVAQYMQAILYLRTSHRKGTETERELLTPLIESFNSRDAGTIRDTLVSFCTSRFELAPEQTLKLLELDRAQLQQERDRTEAAQRKILDPKLIETTVYGSRIVTERSVPESTLDTRLNTWVAKKITQIFIRNKTPLVLIGAADRIVGGDRVNTASPHLIFAWLDKTGEVPEAKISILEASKVFKEMRGRNPKTIEVGEHIPTLEELAYYMDERQQNRYSLGERYHYLRIGEAILVKFLRDRRKKDQAPGTETVE